MPPPSQGFHPHLPDEQSWLRRQARRLLGRPLRGVMDSQDLAQEAHLAAWKGLEGKSFANRSAFRGWLQRILGNRARDAARRAPPPAAAAPSTELPSRDPSPSQGMLHQPEHAAVWQQLRKFPERERTIVHLRLIEDRSFAEIAERLKISEGNARVVFHRAIGALRALQAPTPD